MHNNLLVGLALILVLGIAAQWVAWRLRLPSILILLLVGILAGPVTGVLDIEDLMGELLFPIVSLAVAIILFEGGLSLRFKDIRGMGWVIRNLVTVGVVLTWLISAAAAYVILGLNVEISLLLGAIVVVTGPTVIIPLLNQIRPAGRVSTILRWEGIIIDPVGAILAVLVFEQILIPEPQPTVLITLVTLVKTLLIGIGIGWLVAQIMVELYRRYWVPDSLQNATTLIIIVGAFTVSNLLQAEAGLLTVTIMGIAMANQERFDVKHIVEFKESIQVFLISGLFISLAARIEMAELQQIGLPVLLFAAVIILVERPLAVWLSTIGAGLSWQERLFLSCMAPRGIVAASVSTIFALELASHGVPEAELLVPYTFSIIIITVLLYSLGAGFVARWLELSERNPQGVLIVGASDWVRSLAQEIQRLGFPVVLADTNQHNVEQAQAAGLTAYHGSILSELALDEIDFGGIGRLLAMTPNDEVNALAAEHFERNFGGDNVYELPRPADSTVAITPTLGGRYLFHERATYKEITSRFHAGARICTLTVQDPQELQKQIPYPLLPLLLHTPDGNLQIWALEDPPRLIPEAKLIAMVMPEMETEALHETTAVQTS